MRNKYLFGLILSILIINGTLADSNQVVSGFVVFDASDNYSAVTIVSTGSNVFLGDFVVVEWIANASTYLQFYSDTFTIVSVEANTLGHEEFQLHGAYVDITVGLSEKPVNGETILLQYAYNLDGSASLDTEMEHVPTSTSILTAPSVSILNESSTGSINSFESGELELSGFFLFGLAMLIILNNMLGKITRLY